MNKGIKEQNGKLFYEIDWEFVEEMAKRMASNKGDKYPVFNWKKPIEVSELDAAMTRHFIEIQKGNFDDDGQFAGHYIALACNAMMAVYQLKKYPRNLSDEEYDGMLNGVAEMLKQSKNLWPDDGPINTI